MDWMTITLAGSTTLLSLSHVIATIRHKKPAAEEMTQELKIKEVVEVYDGDTMFVHLDNLPYIFGNRIGIRFYGVDCPEIRTQYPAEKIWGNRATDYVRHVIETSEKIELVNPIRDKFFRVTATVLVDGEDISKMILDEELGLPYTGGKRTNKPWRKL